MKIIDNILYIEFPEMKDCGISENTLKKASSRNSPSWTIINDPNDSRKVLYEYDKLRDQYKELVQNRFGNPHEYVAKQPIKQLVESDHKAREFYFAYRFNGDKTLPIEHVNSYVKAANWLNMLVKLNQDKKYIKKQLGLSLDDFYNNVCEIIAAEKIELPATYQRLRTKMKEYEESGYKCLINGRFGNSNATKVGDDVCESMLLELIAHPNQHDDVIITKAYNSWALNHGYKPISDGTVGNHRRKNYHLLQGYREGNAAAYNTYGKHIMRKRPSAPLLLVGSDDNDLDLYFLEDRKGGVNYYHRFKLIVVMDAFNDYILGYSYGDTVTTDLIKAAFLDAQHHIKDLTGGWHLPHQLQTDRWGKGTLNDWYETFTTYTPATAKVARAKYIEQAFGTTWHQVLKMYPNYAGTNITSQKRLNRDVLELNKKNFPTKDKAYLQIEEFITRMRNQVNDTTGKTRQASWLEAFQASELAQEKRISEARMIQTFGSAHGYTNKITNGGLKVALDGVQRVYDIPDEYYLQNVGKTVQILYDPYDYSRVLVTDNDKLRFVAYEYQKLPSAIADYQPGDKARINAAILQKKRHMELIAANKDKRQSVLEENFMDAASLLQAGVLIKEIKQTAEITYQQGGSRADYDPLDQM